MIPGFKPARKHYTHQKIDGIEHISLLHDNNIGLIDAIKEVGNAHEILRAGRLPRLPKRIIQVKNPVAFKTNGAVVVAQPDDYIAAYKRVNDVAGNYLVARIDKSIAINNLKRYTDMLQKSSDNERNHLFDIPTCPILENAFYGVTCASKADILYDNPNGKTELKKIIRAHKETPVRTLGTDNAKKSYTQRIMPGQLLALIQNKNGSFCLGFIMPEDLTSIKAYYRHQERLIEKQTLLSRIIASGKRQRSLG